MIVLGVCTKRVSRRSQTMRQSVGNFFDSSVVLCLSAKSKKRRTGFDSNSTPSCLRNFSAFHPKANCRPLDVGVGANNSASEKSAKAKAALSATGPPPTTRREAVFKTSPAFCSKAWPTLKAVFSSAALLEKGDVGCERICQIFHFTDDHIGDDRSGKTDNAKPWPEYPWA